MIEDRGLESLWFAEHSHLPVGTDRAEGGDGGTGYAKTFDPFVAMTAAAAATTTLKVATGMCLVPQPDPIHTAKEVATVDVLFDGRVIFGVGAGRTVEDRVLAFGDGWAPMIAGIEDDVFDRFARLQDRTDKPLELTASGPAPDRRALARLRDRGAHRALVWLPQDAGGAISDSDTERFLDDVVAKPITA